MLKFFIKTCENVGDKISKMWEYCFRVDFVLPIQIGFQNPYHIIKSIGTLEMENV